MLRLLIIFILIGYLLYKLGFFRVYVHSNMRDREPNRDFNRRPPDGNVNIDSVPQKEKKQSEYKGGEYIDYEEVK